MTNTEVPANPPTTGEVRITLTPTGAGILRRLLEKEVGQGSPDSGLDAAEARALLVDLHPDRHRDTAAQPALGAAVTDSLFQ